MSACTAAGVTAPAAKAQAKNLDTKVNSHSLSCDCSDQGFRGEGC